MARKNYNSRRKQDSGAEYEITGWVLALCAAFILICIVFPVLLGVISTIIYGFVISLLGFSAYPIFLCMLITGIFLIQGKDLAVSKSTLLCVVVIAIALIMILHLATTYSIIESSFGDYCSAIFNIDGDGRVLSAGGIVFGTLVYGIASIITPIFSFVVYGFIALGLIAFLVNKSYKFINTSKKIEEPVRPTKPTFSKGYGDALQVQPLQDTSLFVDLIQPPTQYNSSGGTFQELSNNEPQQQLASQYSQAPKELEEYNKNTQKKTGLFSSSSSGKYDFEPYNQNDINKKDYKTQAHEFLFGDREKPSLTHTVTSNNYTPISSKVPTQTQSAPDIQHTNYINPSAPGQERERKVVHEVPLVKPPKKVLFSQTQELQHIPEIPDKDFPNDIEDKIIINGDERSEQLAAQNKIIDEESHGLITEKTNEEISNPYQNNNYTQYSGFDTRKIEPVHIEPKPIVQTNNFEEEKAKLENVYDDYNINTEDLSKITSTFDTNFAGEFDNSLDFSINEQEERQESKEQISPFEEKYQYFDNETIDEFDEDISAESEFENQYDFSGLQDDENKLDNVSAEFDDTLTDNDTIIEESSLSSAFDIINDVVDLTENKGKVTNDHTGYYKEVDAPADTMSFESKIKRFDASKKENKPIEDKKTIKPFTNANQVQMDTYLASEAQNSMPASEVPKKKRKRIKYTAPPVDLLVPSVKIPYEEANSHIEENARLIEQTLKELKFPATVSAITRGPAVTRYELETPPGIPIKKIISFVADLSYNLAANNKIRIETPIPGKRAVGIEVSNEKVDIVGLRDIIDSKEFKQSKSNIALAVGQDIAGANIICELEKMPHLLIAGATGSGKSACLNSIIMSIVYKSSPDDVRLILIDPKHVEFTMYKGLPHLMTGEIINDSQQALNAFKWLRAEMERRYKAFSQIRVRNLSEYNSSEFVKSGEGESLSNIVLIVDELAELMMSNNRKDLEENIMSMAQKARAAGIHLILATQRPSVDVITGTIKANLPSRIAFSVKSIIDSRTILDESGAEVLLGRGDMLYAPIGVDDAKRVQGAYVTNEEVTMVVDYVKDNNESNFDSEFSQAIVVKDESHDVDKDDDGNGYDPLMQDILKIFIEMGTASASFIQRRFAVGYQRAARIIDQMEFAKFIGPLEGGKARPVYISREQFAEIFGEEL